MTIYNFTESNGTSAATLGLLSCSENDGIAALATNGSGQLQNTSGTLWQDAYSPTGDQNSHGKIVIPSGQTPFSGSFNRYFFAACRRTSTRGGYMGYPRSSTNDQIVDQVTVIRSTLFGGFVNTIALASSINLATTALTLEIYITNTVDIVVITNGESNTLSGSGGNDNSGNAVLTGGAAGFSIYNNTPPGSGGLIESFDDGSSDIVAPSLTVGPTASSITSAGFTISGTPDEAGTAYLIVTAVGASQPADATFDASTETASITASSNFNIAHTGQ